MKRFYQLLALVLVVTIGFVTTRYALHQRVRSLAVPVVWELGGKVGSITGPFGGAEYSISFPGQALTRDDIDRLAVLNALAMWSYVGLSLHDVAISGEDREYLRQKLPHVHVSSP